MKVIKTHQKKKQENFKALRKLRKSKEEFKTLEQFNTIIGEGDNAVNGGGHTGHRRKLGENLKSHLKYLFDYDEKSLATPIMGVVVDVVWVVLTALIKYLLIYLIGQQLWNRAVSRVLPVPKCTNPMQIIGLVIMLELMGVANSASVGDPIGTELQPWLNPEITSGKFLYGLITYMDNVSKRGREGICVIGKKNNGDYAHFKDVIEVAIWRLLWKHTKHEASSEDFYNYRAYDHKFKEGEEQ